MSLWKQFKTEHKLEIDGIEIKPAEPNEDGTVPTFILARIGGQNHQFVKVREKVMRPYLREIESGTLQPETQVRLNVEVFCKANLRGWSNIQNQNGEPIPFNYENAMNLFRELPDLYMELAVEASKITNYQAQDKEIAEKN